MREILTSVTDKRLFTFDQFISRNIRFSTIFLFYLLAGIYTLEQIASPELTTHKAFKKVPKTGRAKIREASAKLADKLVLFKWLEEHNLIRHKDR